MKRSTLLVWATALLAVALGVLPAGAQERQYAITMFDFDAQNKRAPAEVLSQILLQRGTGYWILCIYGYSSANKKATIKYALRSYDVVANEPFDVVHYIYSGSGRIKVRRGAGAAYGEQCFSHSFNDWGGLGLHAVSITTKKANKQPAGSHGEWGIVAWPMPVDAVGLGSRDVSGGGSSTVRADESHGARRPR